MAYESFTLNTVEKQFALEIVQDDDGYESVPPHKPSSRLEGNIELNLPLVTGQASEKARSELLISPVLVEVRAMLQNRIMVFSGIAFNVDKKAGLHGYCDFLVTRNPLVDIVKSPVIMLVEAKREDLSAGVPQCIAEMVAAQRFNEVHDEVVSPVYGVVTDGSRWRFLRLEKAKVTIDLRVWSIPAELPQILGILTHMAS